MVLETGTIRRLKDRNGVVFARAGSCTPLPDKWWEADDGTG